MTISRTGVSGGISWAGPCFFSLSSGLFLPFLQGILFIMIALTILAPEVPAFRRLIATLRKHCPAVFEKAAEMKASLQKRFGQP